LPAPSFLLPFSKKSRVVRTIGIARANLKIGMTNLAYNMRRFEWLRTKYAAA